MSDLPSTDAEDVEEAARGWYLRLVGGDARRGELAALEKWLAERPDHRAAFARARAIYTSAVADPLAVARKVERRSRDRRRYAMAGAACAGALALAVLPNLPWLTADQATATGEIRRLALPDGTIAYLDTGSALDMSFQADGRTIELRRGRAWFKVAHESRPFRVRAAGADISDVGTAFSVELRDKGGVEVSVEDGLVDVRIDGVTRRLARGSQGTFVPGAPVRMANVDHDVFRWREGRLSFDNRPLGDVLAEIGRYRHGYIYVTDREVAARRVSAMLSVDALDSGLAALAESQHLRIRHVTPWLLVVSAGEAQ
ncbi:FecR domain-containing protein [Sphingomonas sp.]|uniref:FecR family protein n=1 Tax=Sphingomonas sp. TaxID=28214 RepID=UPI0025DDD743|nr:FecR domain-containing protein [Sphingomonas sp.]